jgi:hypothetical protein
LKSISLKNPKKTKLLREATSYPKINYAMFILLIPGKAMAAQTSSEALSY